MRSLAVCVCVRHIFFSSFSRSMCLYCIHIIPNSERPTNVSLSPLLIVGTLMYASWYSDKNIRIVFGVFIVMYLCCFCVQFIGFVFFRFSGTQGVYNCMLLNVALSVYICVHMCACSLLLLACYWIFRTLDVGRSVDFTQMEHQLGPMMSWTIIKNSIIFKRPYRYPLENISRDRSASIHCLPRRFIIATASFLPFKSIHQDYKCNSSRLKTLNKYWHIIITTIYVLGTFR